MGSETKPVLSVGLAVSLLLSVGSGLSGCAAPLVLGAWSAAGLGLGGFALYKTVQTASGGKVGVAFENELPKGTPKETAMTFKKIGVWPIDNTSTEIAQLLSGRRDLDITSPAQVSELMKDKEVVSLDGLLENEKRDLFSLACQRGQLDAVYYLKSAAGSQIENNTFSFKKAQSINEFRHGLYDCASSDFVLDENGKLIVDLGGSIPSTSEVEHAAAEVTADRVEEFLGVSQTASSE